MTGTGVGGSGGAEIGRVASVVVKGTGHLIPMEKVEETGNIAAGWIGKEMERWRENEELVRKAWEKVPDREKYTLDGRYMEGFASFGMLKPKKQDNSKL